MSSVNLLIVEDDDFVAELLSVYLEDQQWRAVRANSVAQALRLLHQQEFDAALCDYQLPDGNGINLIRQVKQHDRELPIIFMTGHGSIDTAVAAMQAGAFEYLAKPLNMDEVLIKVKNALDLTHLRRNLRQAQDELERRDIDFGIIGRSDAMRSVLRTVRIVARSEVDSVLITGESGVGKNLVALAIHKGSERHKRAFVEITCTALPDHLLESELFGHERGAFTDARQPKTGLLETADGGTAFLDEIGDMSLPLQSKLLGFLESRRLRRVGSTKEREIDVRVIAASNRSLQQRVAEQHFREDLLYRLNVIEIHIPALRQRRQDIPLLAMHFLKAFAQKQKKSINSLTDSAIELLTQYPWPGNVRQLRNAVERAVVFCQGNVLDARDFSLEGPAALPNPSVALLDVDVLNGMSLADLDRECVRRALKQTNGNKSAAARLLGITRNQIMYRVKKYGF
ncbi:MAG: sigma-54-dependent Fis family transcriptional regulator [Acidobacteria bacterium]|nr:sigma-54-dependent Fis family transcriptional regulator [Acidobacteriota bacterium]